MHHVAVETQQRNLAALRALRPGTTGKAWSGCSELLRPPGKRSKRWIWCGELTRHTTPAARRYADTRWRM
jgi:hypothetical protein